MPRPLLIAIAGAALLAAAPLQAQPESDSEAWNALFRMREALTSLNAYEATIHRTSQVTDGASAETAETTVEFAFAKPNRVRAIFNSPEGQTGVICDGTRLVVWSELIGKVVGREAPATLSELLEATDGLAAEGLLIAGLFFTDQPVSDLTAGFDEVSMLGRASLNGMPCTLVGLGGSLGQRLVIWFDEATQLPIQARLDATAALRGWAAEVNVNTSGLQMLVTETHTAVRVDPPDLTFDASLPAGLEIVPTSPASPEERSGALEL